MSTSKFFLPDSVRKQVLAIFVVFVLLATLFDVTFPFLCSRTKETSTLKEVFDTSEENIKGI